LLVIQVRPSQERTELKLLSEFRVPPHWDTYEVILKACRDAWNKLMRMPERIASLTQRSWAKPVNG
jgi:hypothetical protein